MKAPTRLGRYQILDRIGAGGMGEVYRARDSELGRIVAVKVLRQLSEANPEHRARFRREARAAAALNHPNIATVFDFGEETGGEGEASVLFLAMEYVEGESLERALGREPDLEDVVRVGIRIARGLQAAHAAGLVHRDLKSSNILITRNDRGQIDGVKILDFGLAKAYTASEAFAEFGQSDMSLTQEGRVVGTPHYMAPELFKGVAADPRSDLFSFGVVLYRLLARRLPFPGDSLIEVLESLAGSGPPPLEELRRDLPPELVRVVHKLLERSRERRYAEAREVEADLMMIAGTPGQFTPYESPTQVVPSDPDGFPGPAPEPDSAAGSRRRKLGRAAAAVAVVGMAALGVWLYRAGSAPESSIPRQRLAILSFANLTGDPGLQYLSPGLSSFLINRLADLPELEVLSSSFTRSYENSDSGLRDLAAQDRLDRVVEGQLQGNAGELQVLVNLTDARDGSVVWSSTFEGDAGELLLLQSQIAAALGDRLALSEGSRDRLARPPTVSEEALHATMEGLRYLEDTSSPIAATTAAHLFERAVAADDGFALAHYGLSAALLLMAESEAEADLIDRAEAAARTALRLDPDSHLPRLALAKVHGQRGDYGAALRELEDALLLQPNAPELYEEIVFAHERGGDDGAAEANLARLSELIDPSTVYRQLGLQHELAGDVATAESYFRRAIGSDPSDWRNWNTLGSFLMRGRVDLTEARDALERATRMAPGEDLPRDNLAAVHLYGSDWQAAVDLLEARQGPIIMASTASNLGTAYFYLGDLAKAESAYLRAVALETDNYVYHANLGDLYVRRGDAAAAATSYEAALRILEDQLVSFPDRRDLLSSRAMMLAKLGRCAEAAGPLEALHDRGRGVEDLIRLSKANALCARVEPTLELVGRLREIGFQTELLREDDEFRPVAADPRFQELTTPSD
ncbi:MAG: protein kinase [Thermoanaerobaculia bacterium]|nr:protein kinase [Thermoanaerobaculia bacterium]